MKMGGEIEYFESSSLSPSGQDRTMFKQPTISEVNVVKKKTTKSKGCTVPVSAVHHSGSLDPDFDGPRTRNGTAGYKSHKNEELIHLQKQEFKEFSF